MSRAKLSAAALLKRCTRQGGERQRETSPCAGADPSVAAPETGGQLEMQKRRSLCSLRWGLVIQSSKDSDQTQARLPHYWDECRIRRRAGQSRAWQILPSQWPTRRRAARVGRRTDRQLHRPASSQLRPRAAALQRASGQGRRCRQTRHPQPAAGVSGAVQIAASSSVLAAGERHAFIGGGRGCATGAGIHRGAAPALGFSRFQAP